MINDDVKFKISATDRTKAAINGFKKNLAGAKASVISFRGALAGLLVAGALGRLASKALDAADEIQKLTQSTGVSAEALSAYRFVASQANVEFELLTKGIVKMQKSIFDANSGLSTSIRAFEKLNVPLEALSALKPEQQFELLADRLSKVRSESDRTGIAMDIFGRAGSKLNNVFFDGAEGIRKQRLEAAKLNLTLSQGQVEAAAAANDGLDRLGKALKGGLLQTFIALAPAIETVAVFLGDAVLVAIDAVGIGFRLAQKAVLFFNGSLIAVLQGITFIGSHLPIVGESFRIFNAALTRSAESTRAMNSSISILSDSTDALGESTNGAITLIKDLGLSVKKVRGFLVDTAKAQVAVKEETDRAAKAAQEYINTFSSVRTPLEVFNAQVKKLNEQFALFGDGETLARALAVAQGELNDALGITAAKAKEVADAQAAANKTSEEAIARQNAYKQVIADTRTPLEAFNSELARQAEIFGFSEDLDTFTRAVAQAQEQFNQLTLASNDESFDPQSFINQFATEEELLQNSQLRRSLIITEALNANHISQQTANALFEKEELKHQKSLLKLEQKGYTARQKFENSSLAVKSRTIFDQLDSITQGVASHNKTLFKINKIASIGQAIISTYVGVSKTLAAYPYPFNLVFAGAHLAAGLAQVSAIRSTSFDSGGGAGGTLSGGGAVGTFPADPVTGFSEPAAAANDEPAVQQVEVRLTFDDDQLFTGRQLRQFSDQLREQFNTDRVAI